MAVNYEDEKGEGKVGSKERHVDDGQRFGQMSKVGAPATLVRLSGSSFFESTPLFAFQWDFPAENESVLHQIVNIEMQ